MIIKTETLVKMALLAALSIVLAYFVHFPIFPTAAFLEYDMADVPILIGAFLFGPVNGLALTVVASVLQGVTVSAASGWVGVLMHFFATGAYVMTAGTIYKKRHDRVGAVIGLCAGTAAMTLAMIPLNLIFTVYFLGAPFEAVRDMLIPTIIPFNLIKAGANGMITFFVYKAVARILRTELEQRETIPGTK